MKILKRLLFYSIILLLAIYTLGSMIAFRVLGQTPATFPGIVNNINDSGIKVRSGPNVLYDTIGHLNVGAQVEILTKTGGGDWLKINYGEASAETGWVFARYIDFETSAVIPIDPDYPNVVKSGSTTEASKPSWMTQTPVVFTNTSSNEREIPKLGTWLVISFGLGVVFIGIGLYLSRNR